MHAWEAGRDETFVCRTDAAVYYRGVIAGSDRKEPTMSATYDLKHGASGEKYRFNLKAANGEVILVSETYESKEGALNGIASVKKNGPIAELRDHTTH